MKIALCLPTGDMVNTDFAMSLFSLRAKTKQELILINARTSIIEQSRFILAREALKLEATHLFFIDSDIAFPDDALDRLLVHDKDIVGATYIRRREPHTILGYAPDGADIEAGQTGLVKMARVPFGFMLIKADVFQKIPRPWFNTWFDEENDCWTSEDYKFCDLVIEHGFDVYIDLDLSHELAHCGMHAWWWGRPEKVGVCDG